MLLTIEDRLAAIPGAIRRVSAQEAAEESSSNKGIIVDVRETAEQETAPVPSAIRFSRGMLEMKMLQAYPDPSLPVYLHCASGVRALLAAEQLVKMGYENVSAITSNIKDVQQAFEKTVTKQG
ncbi:rhodanese-like domain-containing protein [Alteromonas pelagimontana]|uniref:Rhodanese-like domain-containing protein n=1 Tax=Alteromonas pelagimontana TaxID=1858656 RepID=A0A6M4MI91_9ALTE|nr:rhodanese-like domain-containing protein [Alteromonas pelagimontana]QJR82320.1 rhodanese-like domain-containing protein [Alteromonas pelagimontana]